MFVLATSRPTFLQVPVPVSVSVPKIVLKYISSTSIPVDSTTRLEDPAAIDLGAFWSQKNAF